MRQNLFDGDHADVATSLDSLGNVYNELGKHELGLEYMQCALRMRQSLFGS